MFQFNYPKMRLAPPAFDPNRDWEGPTVLVPVIDCYGSEIARTDADGATTFVNSMEIPVGGSMQWHEKTIATLATRFSDIATDPICTHVEYAIPERGIFVSVDVTALLENIRANTYTGIAQAAPGAMPDPSLGGVVLQDAMESRRSYTEEISALRTLIMTLQHSGIIDSPLKFIEVPREPQLH